LQNVFLILQYVAIQLHTVYQVVNYRTGQSKTIIFLHVIQNVDPEEIKTVVCFWCFLISVCCDCVWYKFLAIFFYDL